MPRLPRLHVPGGTYHVLLRGNGRRDVFFDENDRKRWETLIESGLRRYQHRIHAYCWMTNHVHLAVQSSNSPLSGFMRFVASQYARSTNRKIDKSGHLFERRHRAILVKDDTYLKELIRYIHLNPVRGGLTTRPEDYQWSSHKAYLGSQGPTWLNVDWALRLFGNTEFDARCEYARFLQSDVSDSMLQQLRQGGQGDSRILGDDGFASSFHTGTVQRSPTRTLESLIAQVCLQHGVPESALSSSSRKRIYSQLRAEIGLAAIEEGLATNAELAKLFNRGQSGMSRAIDQLRRRRTYANK
ncbi:MAG: transposase [Woeseiaceae bacterium]|nr:transposase [Woeseiaceae bacterium]